jgi:hypothetical protein
LFTGNVHFQGAGVNLLIAGIILLFAHYIYKCFKQKEYSLAYYFSSLFFVSLGAIAVNVFVSGSHYMVCFPMNYSTKVDWSTNIYQQADLHFSYAYLCLCLILVGIIYVLHKKSLNMTNCHNIIERRYILVTYFLLAILAIFSAKPRLTFDTIVVAWKDVYQVTARNKFFVAINTEYNVAPISLEHGTDEYIYGVNAAGKLYLWNYGLKQYELFKPFQAADIGQISDIQDKLLFSVTARKALTNFNRKYYAVLKDSQENIIAKIEQAQKEDRYWLDFIPEQPVKNVKTISFELENGAPAYIQNGLQVGYIK